MKIIKLFPQNHKRLQTQTKNTVTPDLTIQICIASYHDFLHSISAKWEKLSNKDLFEIEKHTSRYLNFLNAKKEEQYSFIINKNPYLSIYEIPKHWPIEAKKLLKERINRKYYSNDFDIAYFPCLLECGFKEIIINDLSYNILILLQQEKTFHDLLNKLLSCFSTKIKEDKDQPYRLVITELEYLLYNGLIYTTPLK